MALRRPPTTFSDEISAADLAANSVGASELADNAVDTAAIANDAVDATKIATGAVVADGLGADSVTAAAIATGAVVADGLGAGAVTATAIGTGAVTATKLGDVIGVKPHIQPGVLQPAVEGRLLDGTTTDSGNYGTAQADGHSYYYTDIKGSKPIKDPRIGAHFGSQRHQFSSVQRLEQESSAHGEEVSSIDGREWARHVGGIRNYSNDWGLSIQANTKQDTWFYEITGYFNQMNFIGLSYANASAYGAKYALNTSSYTTLGAADDLNTAQRTSPLKGRYVNSGSVRSLPFTTTLGINTVKISTGAPLYLSLIHI